MNDPFHMIRVRTYIIQNSFAVLGNTVNGDGVEEEDGLERFKDVRGMWLSSNKGDGEISGSGTTGSGSEGDAGSLTRPPFTIATTSTHHSRKKPKLQAKVSCFSSRHFQ